MIIGIDASRAFVSERTGIEEYSYQVIKHLTDKLAEHRVILYIRGDQRSAISDQNFTIPEKWRVKKIRMPKLWTQVGLSLEMFFHPPDVLFVPSHVVPLIHPKNTLVTVHGLEYEILPFAYSLWEKLYMRWSIKFSCLWAKKIIAVSENTKKDLIKLYRVPEGKIKVIYEGRDNCHSGLDPESSEINNDKYLLFIGRLEERKNIIGIARAFEILKEHYEIPHKLVLAGKFGYGEAKIRQEIKNINCPGDIVLTGFVSEEEKWKLLKNAEVFLFPTFYEGFGLPVLEAQSVGVPVVAGNNSSIPEIAKNNSVILVNPDNAEEIADKTYEIISEKKLRDDMRERGYENAKQFSWDKCAEEIAEILVG